MPRLAILFGLLLCALGAVSYFSPDLIGEALDPDKGHVKSITALIPAFFGVALLLCGFISSGSPEMRKHAMHVAAMVSLLGLIGAMYRPISKLTQGGEVNFATAPVRGQSVMAILCLVFLILCIRSFVQARILRKSSVTSASPAP